MQTRDLISILLHQTRTDAGVSMEEMARMIGVSKKTVQNWESGIGCPTLDKSIEWFQALHVQPLPYYLQLLYNGQVMSRIDDDDIENTLIKIIKELTPDHKRQLLFCLFAHHGSSPSSVIEMVTAHLHTPLRDRINIAWSIVNNYNLSAARGDLVAPDIAVPNMDLLIEAVIMATEATINGRNEYALGDRDETETGNEREA